MALDALLLLKKNGYKVSRMGLDFKILLPETGLNKIISHSELLEMADKINQVIL